MMQDPAVPLGRRRRDPALLAVLAALGLAVLALIAAAYGLLGGGREHAPWTVGALAAAVAALVVAGVVVRGRLAAARRAHEREVFFARVLARLQGPEGFSRSLGTVLQECRDFFRASGVAVPVRDALGGRVWLWGVPGGAAAGTPARAVELAEGAAEDWLFDTAVETWEAEANGRDWRLRASDGSDVVVPLPPLEKLARRLGARRLTVCGFGRGRDWEGRLVLVDADGEGSRAEALLFAERLVREIGGVVQSRFLLGRLRTRIGAMERARVARELHDGTIQSLVAVEMEVDVLRRRAHEAGLPVAGDLARVQGLLRSEILELRDTMQRLKPIEVAPDQLVGYLDAMVARFERDTGIRAIFDCAVEDVDLPARVCREVGRIVQEALQNVRKHSGARNVLVRFARAPSGWRLVVDDDGRGFAAFSGTLTDAQLGEGRKGPYVIRERVRGLGGGLTIDSSSGGGACLEILLPLEAP